MIRLGIIGGGGWLGQAVARAVLDAGLTTAEGLTLSYRSAMPQGFDGTCLTRDSQELADRSDVIILSVRPEDWPLEFDAKAKLVISVMAGISLSDLAAHHNSARVIRALPNAAAEVGASYTPLVGTTAAQGDDMTTARRIFACCGLVDQVASESQLDYLSGLTGTGPAYPALIAAAMERDAMSHGLSLEVARRAVAQLFIGTGRLLEAHPADPDKTVETFMAYRGITAAGLSAMRDAGLDGAIAAGLSAAHEKALAMGRKGAA